ncbi:replication-relaxation family protein [Streptomyces capoamus]|uniref:replication-relaxation family protein n=1 Tax=Streptomyces capoamus TaxID=68183 RepID=UPI001675BD11|nr:replication-relaxation family protein [Streptomyces capoamus]
MTARLSLARVETLAAALSPRDRSIILDLARARMLRGSQMTRLHFDDLAPNSRDRVRRKVLSRLISIGFVATLERPIGGVRAGSSGLIYVLDSGGQRALPFIMAAEEMEPPTRARKPWTPGQAFLLHSLDVSELYVRLVEARRSALLHLAEFLTEPASWFSNGMGGILKPDAYALLQSGDIEDCWAIEVDRATESLLTLRRKLLAYVDFAHAGQVGPHGVTPRVLVTVPHEKRLTALQRLVAELPEPAPQLLYVTLFEDAIQKVTHILKE